VADRPDAVDRFAVRQECGGRVALINVGGALGDDDVAGRIGGEIDGARGVAESFLEGGGIGGGG
jgi:hypothetical protein